MHYFLYCITNTINGKIYIGQTNNLKRRWTNHKSLAGKSNQYIHRAMAKYGINNFTIDVIAKAISLENANLAEQQLVQQYNSNNPDIGYNLTIGGDGRRGIPHTQEWKDMMSERMSGDKHPMFGQTHTPEAIDKIKLARAEQVIVHSDQTKDKIRQANTGKTATQETKEKMSQSAQGKHNGSLNPSAKLTEEQIVFIRNFPKGYGQIKKLAEMLAVSTCTISRVLTNKMWKDSNK